MRFFLWRQTASMIIALSLTVFMEPAWGRNDGEGQSASFHYSLSYSPIYQFEADLDDGGSFDVSRHYLRLNITRSVASNLRLGLGLSYDLEKWDFKDRSSVAGATPWATLHRPGLSLPLFYTFADSWTLGVTPTIELAGESGAEFDQSLTYGGILSLAHPFGRNLYLGIGFGIFDELEETAFFPFIVIDWKINDQFRLTNPFRAGPAGPAGLELVYTPAENWELGVGGAYRSFRFRLEDENAVSNGVGENEFLVTFLRVQRKIGSSGLALDLAGGALLGGEVSVENENGDNLGSEDYDPAPFLALTIAGQF